MYAIRSYYAIRDLNPQTLIEVLIPDFQGNGEALAAVLTARPEVLNHNLETVKSLYGTVRPQADYGQSLEVLHRSKLIAADILTKCGIMVGIGESREELVTLMRDLRAVRCDILTIGQYLQPSKEHLEVVRYLPPEA